MADSLVVTALQDFKRRLAAMEAAQMQEMATRWLGAEQALQSAMDALAQDIAARLARGETITANTLYQMDRYKIMLGQAQQELDKYTDYVSGVITRAQGTYVQLGIEDAIEAMSTQYRQAGVLQATFGRLAVNAVNEMIGMASDGSPLRALLQASWPDAVAQLTQAIIDNIALGKNPRTLARVMAKSFDVPLQRALVLARDQQLRAYRSAADEQYKASGVVTARYRLATHDERVCLACLAADGEEIPQGEPMFDHPQGRCVAVVGVKGLPLVQWEKGAEWFAGLSEEQQRDMMGDKRYEAWRNGDFEFKDLAQTTHSDVWGSGLMVPSTKELVGNVE